MLVTRFSLPSIRLHGPSALITAALLSQVGCKQPDLDCTSAHGTFAASFELKKGAADSPCGGLTVDILGMQTYFAEGGPNGTPKFAESTVAIRAQYLYAYAYDTFLGAMAGEDDSMSDWLKQLDDLLGDPDSIGDFTVGVDGEGFCSVPKMSRVDLTLPEIVEIPAVEDDPSTPDVDETDPGAPGQAAATLRYEWDNVKFLVTADAQGTQFVGDLKFTQDGATCEYHVLAVYPDFGCEVDDDCHAEGSPLNPDFALKCLEGLCVLKDEPPAYE